MTTRDTERATAKKVLTDREWSVYELRVIHRFSLRQIAAAEDLSLSTVRSTIERIERKLRKAA